MPVCALVLPTAQVSTHLSKTMMLLYRLVACCALLAVMSPGALASQEVETCRSQCFAELDSQVFDKFKKLTNTVRHMYQENYITGMAVLYDNTLHEKHESDEESNVSLQLEFYQRLLAALAVSSVITGIDSDNNGISNPVYFAQFDDNSAWSCNSWRCTSGCDALNSLFSDLHHFTESKFFGRLEEACYIAEVAQHDHRNFCGGDSENRLAVAILNSPVWLQFKEHKRFSKNRALYGGGHNYANEEHDGYHTRDTQHKMYFDDETSCCGAYKHRMAIGHHRASKFELESWASSKSDSLWLDMDHRDYDALYKMVECITNCACGFSPKEVFANYLESGMGRSALTDVEECQISEPRFTYNIYNRAI